MMPSALIPLLLLAAPPVASSYFEASPFLEAQVRLARGQTKEAAELLRQVLAERVDREERPQALYLLGLCLLAERAYGEAERLFAELVDIYPELRDDHIYLRGKALYEWGNHLEASRVLAAVDEKGPRAEEARLLRARALYDSTDFETLRHWLEASLARDGRLEPELLYLLGHARHHQHDVYGAYQAYKEVWREAPGERFAGPALRQMAELKIGQRSLMSKDEQAAVAALGGVLAKGRIGDALESLEHRLARAARSMEFRAQLAYARGRLAETQGRGQAAASHFDRAFRLAPARASELRARARLHHARALERLGQSAQALAIYEDLAERFPERPEAEEALFSAGEMQLHRREYALAKERFRELLLKNPVTVYRPRSLWALGWAERRLGNYEEARPFFGALTKMALSADLAAASSYWLAKTDADHGDTESAREGFRQVLTRHPLSYYAALAEDQLAEALPSGAGAPNERRAPEPLPPLIAQAEEYLRLGLVAKARAALEAFQRRGRPTDRAMGERTLRSIARLHDELGRNTEARKLRETYAREYPHALTAAELVEAARRAHPLRYEAEIIRAAEEFELSPALLFALVRTESAFVAEAVSPMNAYGLAQLILPTAREVAGRLHAGRVSPGRLVSDPGFNVRLGAAYLRGLLDHFDGSEPLALAAYNAGPHAVGSWMAYRVRRITGLGDRGKGVGLLPRPDELVEEIPVTETRGYVKAVLARARSYARLYPLLSPPSAPTSTPVADRRVPAHLAGPDREPVWQDPPAVPASTEPVRPRVVFSRSDRL